MISSQTTDRAIAVSAAASGLQGITERGKHTIYDAPTVETSGVYYPDPADDPRNKLNYADYRGVYGTASHSPSGQSSKTAFDPPPMKTPAQSFMDAYDRLLDIKAHLADPSMYWHPKA